MLGRSIPPNASDATLRGIGDPDARMRCLVGLGPRRALTLINPPLRLKLDQNTTLPAEYFQGMLTSNLTARSEENLDNLSPNIKFVGASLFLTFALTISFLYMNKLL